MIRLIRDDELEKLLGLYTHLHDNAVPAVDDRIKSVWESIVNDKNHNIIVAEEQGEIVSSCVCVIVRNLTHGQRPYALIENVVTNPHYRNKGLATACLSFAKELAVTENCYKIMLMTGSKSSATLDFYRKAGYNSNDKTAFIMWL
ncbi:MAG: GNAT family N-acetyltransferase [Oscillospiraceae bacterium]|nr:GNAT family N-acetyltransferase [Oscillospiraceae bacterium]